jgi:prepilin-type processing-associated H-X9-DG protein
MWKHGVPGVDCPWRSSTNWAIALLPYVEQRSLANMYDPGSANVSPANRPARESKVHVYRCPSDRHDRLQVPALGPGADDAANASYMPGSYRAVSGRSDGYVFLDVPDGAQFPKEPRGPIHVVGPHGFRSERFRDVVDGTSNTLLVGESVSRTNPGHGTLWAYSHSFYSLSAATPQPRTVLGDFERCVDTGGTGGKAPCQRGWGSPHGGGMNFLACDSSVHYLATDIDLETFASLATVDGGRIALIPREL